MRSIYKLVVCSLLTLSITSCEKDLLEKEQYQKEIYLIGAYNRVWTTEVSYSNEEVKTYFTVSSSGTLALDRDVNVKMKINEEPTARTSGNPGMARMPLPTISVPIMICPNSWPSSV